MTKYSVSLSMLPSIRRCPYPLVDQPKNPFFIPLDATTSTTSTTIASTCSSIACRSKEVKKKKIMEIDTTGNPNWLFDYELMADITSAADFQSPATLDFTWPSQTIYASSNVIAETEYTLEDSEVSKEASSRKRSRIECCSSPGSKACREKLRRDRLNERFLELSTVLDPGRPPKTEKVAILSDAQKMLIDLRTEAQKVKESNQELQEKIRELKAEKNELRDEKQRLKEEKENLEQQVKSLASKPGFLSHSAMGAAFTAQGQVAGNKLMPFIGYPSVAMWQFMQPAVVDTSQDHMLRPPVA